MELSDTIKAIIFFSLIGLCFIPGMQPAVGLLLGIVFSLLLGNPWRKTTGAWSGWLLKLAVVGLGFGMNFNQVLVTGKQAAWFTFVAIAGTMIIGIALGRLLHTKKKTSVLITAGTAICGGSAIAAMGPAIRAKNKHIAVSLATVFFLNGIALLVLPPIGHWFKMSEEVFGIWAAMVIHDTNSVAGATVVYGPLATTLGLTVKLTRALWILPLTFFVGYCYKSKKKAPFPYFLVAFVMATILSTFVPQAVWLWLLITAFSRQMLTPTLFLVGAGITRKLIRKIGFRSFAQAVLLWVIIATLNLLAILWGWIPNISASLLPSL